MSNQLATAFVAGRNEPRDAAQLAALDAGLAARFESAQRTWPGLHLTAADWAAHLGARAAAGTTLDHLHAEDLYLALACAHGEDPALLLLDQAYLARVPGYVASIDRAPEFADEVRQRLREKLLVAHQGAQPRIADYSGRGPLDSWLRAASVRTALDLRREQGRAADAEAREEQILQGPDPELAYLRARYAPQCQEAFRAALASLSSKERNVLRLHYVERLNLDAVGAVYQVARATVHRWVVAYRQQLLEETRRILGEKLNLSASELDSLIGLVRSQLEVSLRE